MTSRAEWDDTTGAPVPTGYLTLLRHPAPTTAWLAEQGMPDAQVETLLRRLTDDGMVTVDETGVITVVAPDLALPRYARALEQNAAATRAATAELAAIYYGSRVDRDNSAHDGRVVVLSSVEAIGAAVAEAVAAGRRTLTSLRGPTSRIVAQSQLPLELHRQPLVNSEGTPLRVQVCYDTRLLERPSAVEIVTARAEAGEVQRACPGLPFSLVVVDDAAAVIDISGPHRSGPVGLYLRTPSLVEPCRQLATRLWDMATPIARARARSDYDERDRKILSLLASGASDSVIARHLGVSRRTVERRIRILMDRLGAQTRFQAAVLAVQRSWL